MQDCAIAGEAERRQHTLLGLCRIGDQRQGLIGMGGKDHLVKMAVTAVLEVDLDALGMAADLGNRRV
ncbi:hypothetical protein D3C72_2169550 [compost metagenome]